MQECFYTERLANLKLPTLVYRKNRVDAILAYKLMMANALPSLFPTAGPNLRTRSYQRKLVKQSTPIQSLDSIFLLKNR